jgi:hypothetical protein
VYHQAGTDLLHRVADLSAWRYYAAKAARHGR